MTKLEKLLNKFISRPRNFTYNELIRLLRGLGYEELQGSGSRIIFRNKEIKHSIKLHKPHPGNVLKRYQIDLIIQELNSKNML
jgi:predicted RNA binding protein YcfA (HicA-like mRNA interferase family)